MEGLTPPDVGPAGVLFLLAVSFVTSALTAALGIGGGILMLVALALLLPVPALIPIHGLVQLGSNLGRGLVLARSVAAPLLVPFVLAALVGALVGALIVTDLPDRALLAIIGAFVIASTWFKPRTLGRGRTPAIAAVGFGATLLTMFVGATGPLVIAVYRQTGLSHKELVATNAWAMLVQHALKIIGFAALGFAFAPWLPFVAALIAVGFLGTLFGARLLDHLPEQALKRTLQAVLTVSGAHLLARGIGLY